MASPDAPQPAGSDAPRGDRVEHDELRRIIEARTQTIERTMSRRRRGRWLVISAAAGLIVAVGVRVTGSDEPTGAVETRATAPRAEPVSREGSRASVHPPAARARPETASGVRSIGTALTAPVTLRLASMNEELKLLQEHFELRGVPAPLPRKVEEFLLSR